MSSTRWNKAISITNDEVYDLATHTARLADSINAPVPVNSQAERDALAAEGRVVIRQDLGGLQEVYSGGAWQGRGWTAISTLGPGWSAASGYNHAPRLFRQGQMVLCFGALNIGTTGNTGNMCTIPTALRPNRGDTIFIGAGVSSAGASYMLALSNGVMSLVTGYLSGTISANHALPITSSWPLYID